MTPPSAALELPPAHAIHSDIGVVQQHFPPVPALTIRENIPLGVSAGRALGDDVPRDRAGVWRAMPGAA